MSNSCVYIPSKGADLFRELKKQFDHNTARSIFLRAINPDFLNDYKGTLKLNSEGVPTLESLMKNSYMKEFMGLENVKKMVKSKFPILENTRENFKTLVNDAYTFNTSDSMREDYIAVVSYVDDKIGIELKVKTDATVKEFNDQYSTIRLNDKLIQMFSPLGVNIDNLSDAEVAAGRTGLTDFTKAREIGNDFVSIIKVANNLEGAQSISEEFSHLLIGIFNNESLVQRSLQSLQSNEDAMKAILGDEYEDSVKFHNGDMSKVAEEALGQVLQMNLLEKKENIETPAPSLFSRLYSKIVGKFKNYDYKELADTLDSIDSFMSVLASEILNGTRTISQDDIKRTQRNAQFNALSDRISRNIDILKAATNTEIKRYKVSKDANKEAAQSTVGALRIYTQETADTVEGIFNYAKYALQTLKDLEKSFGKLEAMEPKAKFGFLRNVRTYVQSYGSFIKAMQDALIDEENQEDNMFLRNFELDGKEVTTADMIKELNQLSESITSRYVKAAMPAFAEVLKPFLGEVIIVPFGKYAGTQMAVEDLLREAPSDITFMDRWLQSMADSGDVLLQGFDAIVKKANTDSRLETIDFINRIHMFREKAEKMGITDFEWAFEKDNEGNKSGNYISDINYAQYQKDLQEMLARLDEKYGKNPSGAKAQAKLNEKNAWYDTHSTGIFGGNLPNPNIYKNKDYTKLTANQKEILEDFLKLKDELDQMYPDTAASNLKAIQIRKSGVERSWESITSPSTLFENIKESIKSAVLEREDDDQIFGERTKRGLTDFAGAEFMVLPALFTTRLKNPNEISTDLVGSLMAYSYGAIQYKHLDNIVDELEVGKSLVIENRKVLETRGDNKVLEKFDALGNKVVNKVFATRSNIEAKLNDFMEAQVYHRYLKDEGVIPVFGKEVSVNKLAGLLLKGSSLAQLGFNWLANLANVTTGMGMQNIEAASGQFFNFKEMLKADKEYAKSITPYMAELGNRAKTSKLGLFFDLFNVKQNYEAKTKRLQTRNWLKRIFGENIAFLGQEAGDHWLYGRTAIAMALREQVLLNGKKMSLWDALQVQNVSGSNTIKELNYKDIKTLDGKPLDINEFSRRVAHVNQVCFGIYNDEDANAASRVAAGRLLQQYRKWMTIQYSRRFRAGHKNLATDTWEEGYYRTMGRYLQELSRGGFQFAAVYDKMTNEEQRNVKRAVFELAQLFAVWCLANLIDWPDDKDRPWAVKLAEYSSKRLTHELGGLAPSLIMPREILKTVTNPIPATGVVRDAFNLASSAIDPTDWTDEIKSGPYKGLSTFEKNFIKAPIPGVAQYRQVSRFVGDLDTSITYYMRPW